jgi:hypothetical protein
MLDFRRNCLGSVPTRPAKEPICGQDHAQYFRELGEDFVPIRACVPFRCKRT